MATQDVLRVKYRRAGVTLCSSATTMRSRTPHSGHSARVVPIKATETGTDILVTEVTGTSD